MCPVFLLLLWPIRWDFLLFLVILFARILLSVFGSIFKRGVDLKFSLFVGSLCGFGISVTVVS